MPNPEAIGLRWVLLWFSWQFCAGNFLTDCKPPDRVFRHTLFFLTVVVALALNLRKSGRVKGTL